MFPRLEMTRSLACVIHSVVCRTYVGTSQWCDVLFDSVNRNTIRKETIKSTPYCYWLLKTNINATLFEEILNTCVANSGILFLKFRIPVLTSSNGQWNCTSIDNKQGFGQ